MLALLDALFAGYELTRQSLRKLFGLAMECSFSLPVVLVFVLLRHISPKRIVDLLMPPLEILGKTEHHVWGKIGLLSQERINIWELIPPEINIPRIPVC